MGQARAACTVSSPPVSAPAACRSLISFRMSSSELACVYASLILHDDGLDITVQHTSLAASITVHALSMVTFQCLKEAVSGLFVYYSSPQHAELMNVGGDQQKLDGFEVPMCEPSGFRI